MGMVLRFKGLRTGLKYGAITGGVTGLVFRLLSMGLSADLDLLFISSVYAVGGGIAGMIWGIAVKEDRKYFKAGLVAVSAAASILVYVLVILSVVLTASYYPKEQFNRAKWEANIEERYKMSGYIIKKRILIGKTEAEVVELLGDRFYKCAPDAICYTLGFVPGFHIDPDVLRIYFRDGVVVNVDQYTS